MTLYQIYQVDAFTTKKLFGNPAGVVPDAQGLTDIQMQRIARELNNSETAFVLPPDAEDHEVRIKFFTPSTEVPSCGHATIAAHYVRAREHNLPSSTVMQKIGIGTLPVEVFREEDDYRIVMTQGEIEFEEPLPANHRDEILSALGLSPNDLDDRCPIQVVSTGHSKVMIGISSKEHLSKLNPDSAKLMKISSEIGCNGYYVFVLHDENAEFLAEGRMFAPAIGIAEDPVTGNANGPLGAFLVQHQLVPLLDETLSFHARQGEAMGRPGTIEVIVEVENNLPKRVKVGGRAVIAFKTEIEI